MSTTYPSTIALPTQSFSSLIVPIASATSSISSPSSTSMSLPDPDSSNGTGDNDDDPPSKENTLLYYYFFIFLALLIAVVLITFFIWHRRRRVRKALHRNRGQNALQQDLEGWAPGNRRYFGLRPGALNRRRANADEGFNEFGEAPPAYTPKDDVLSSEDQNQSNMPAIPLRTVSRGAVARLPSYDDIVKDGIGRSESSASNTHNVNPRPQEAAALSIDPVQGSSRMSS
jgi:hypothetical protein